MRSPTLYVNNTANEHIKRAQLRSACRQSLYMTVAGVLCHDKSPNKIALNEDIFLPSCRWAEWILQTHKRGWGADPRAHTKSTRWTSGIPAFLAIQRPHKDFDLPAEYDRASKFLEENPFYKGPDQRILIASWGQENANDFSRWIRGRFEGDKLWRWLFPELAYDSGLGVSWNLDSWTLPGRTGTYLEGFVETGGISSQTTSHHYDVIILDDAVTEGNYKSLTDMQTVISWFMLAHKLLNQADRFAKDASVILGIGNMWTDYDLFSFVKENLPEFDIWRRTCWQCSVCGTNRCIDGPSCRPTLQPLWSANYTQQGLLSEKESAIRAGHAKMWYAQMENTSADPETTPFKQEHVHEYIVDKERNEILILDPMMPSRVIERIKRDKLRWYLVCDPANSDDPSACYTAVGHFGEDDQGRQFFDTVILERVAAEDNGAAKLILDLHDRVHRTSPTYTLGIEAISGQRYVISTLVLLAKSRGNNVFAYYDKKSKNQNIQKIIYGDKLTKDERIRALLAPRLREGKLFVNREVINAYDGAFAYQVYRFPNVKEKDLVDMWAASQTLCVGANNSSQSAEVNKARVFHRRLHEKLRAQVGY